MAISWKVCPCDLLIVMAKAGRTGNWRRRIWTGMVLSSASVFMLMRGTQTTFPTWLPVRILAWMTERDKCMITNLVPLARPRAGLTLRSKMIGIPTLRRSSWGAKPGGLIV